MHIIIEFEMITLVPWMEKEITFFWGQWVDYRGVLLWGQNGRDGVSNHQPHHCLLNRLLRRRSKKTSKLRVTGLCAGNSQKASNAENVSIWWRQHSDRSAWRDNTFGSLTPIMHTQSLLIPWIKHIVHVNSLIKKHGFGPKYYRRNYA